MAPTATIRTLVLVEGESDAAAVRALANLIGLDLARHHIWLQAANGVTNYTRALSTFALAYPHAGFCGLYDVANEQYVRRALSSLAAPITDHTSVESFGFFACVADLEDELIRALGAESVQRVIEEQGELASLRRFQAMPQYRRTPVQQQLRRFLGTRATRKIRSAKRLVEVLTVDQLPSPLAGLAARLREAASLAPTKDGA